MKPRRELAGGVHHVTARGNARESIFRQEGDCKAFLGRFEVTVAKFGWVCHAYCLIPNHYHLLLETPEPNLGAGMHALNRWYARRFNLRYDRVGHLFQGPYGAELVQDDPYLLELFRYVALNPVRAGLCSDPRRWRWSSFAATAGLAPVPPFLTTAWAHALFGSPQEYERFVRAGMSRNQVAGHV